MNATKTMRDHSESIAATNIRGGEHTTDLYASWMVLYRHRDGKYYLRKHGGAAIACGSPTWLTRGEAVDWVANMAQDPCTGYGYTREQAEVMVDGVDAGKGWRGR